MNKTARGIIFWFFIAAFLIGAPLSVLYTAGFRYNIKNGNFVRTGVISISSEPRNASISLNNVPLNKETPYVIKRLIPDEYEVTLSKPGFHTWSTETEVFSGITTILESILLFKDATPQALFIKDVQKITPNPNGESLAYTVIQKGWAEIWLYDTEEKTEQLIDRIGLQSLSDIDLQWSAQGSFLLATDIEQNVSHIFNNSGEPIPVDEELFANADQLFWHPSQESILYLSNETELNQLDVITTNITTFDQKSSVTVLIDASIITLFDNGANTELKQTIGDETNLIALLPKAEYTIAHRDTSFFILTDTRNNIFLVDIGSSQPILMQTQASVFDWHDEKNELAYSDGNEVNIYSPESHATEFITRQSALIHQIAWHPSGKSLLMTTKNNISTVDRYKIGKHRATVTLLEAEDIATMSITQDGQFAYLYGIIDGALGLYELALTR